MFSMKQFVPRVKRYLRENPGASFIIGFQILLVVCAGLLIVGNSVWADGLATVAYFSLVIGVVLQLVGFVRVSNCRKDKEVNYARNGGEILAYPKEVIEEAGISSFKPEVSLVIPAFNEEARIANSLLEWIKFFDEHNSRNYEILVVMDGCTDQTVDVVSGLAGKRTVIIPLVCSKRLGKGGALIEAFRQSRGEIIFFADADGSMPTEEFRKFMRVIRRCDLAIGCRYFRGSNFKHNLPLSRLTFSRIFNVLLRIVFPELKRVHDTQCVSNAFRRKAIDAILDDLFISDFAFDVNLIYSALHGGFDVREIGIEYNHVDNGSKVSCNLLKTSFAMFLSIIRLRLYYSKLRELLYADRLKGLVEFLMKWCYGGSLDQS